MSKSGGQIVLIGTPLSIDGIYQSFVKRLEARMIRGHREASCKACKAPLSRIVGDPLANLCGPCLKEAVEDDRQAVQEEAQALCDCGNKSGTSTHYKWCSSRPWVPEAPADAQDRMMCPDWFLREEDWPSLQFFNLKGTR